MGRRDICTPADKVRSITSTLLTTAASPVSIDRQIARGALGRVGRPINLGYAVASTVMSPVSERPIRRNGTTRRPGQTSDESG
jgi:hypothetical protein